jgi:hypothetical protein
VSFMREMAALAICSMVCLNCWLIIVCL